MDFKNKKLVMVLRVLLGLFLIYAGGSGLYMFATGTGMDQMTPEQLVQMGVLSDSGIIYLVKVVELVTGIMLLFNVLPALANLLIAPITVGIIFWLGFLMPSMFVMVVPMALINAYLGYVYWDKYKALFSQK